MSWPSRFDSSSVFEMDKTRRTDWKWSIRLLKAPRPARSSDVSDVSFHLEDLQTTDDLESHIVAMHSAYFIFDEQQRMHRAPMRHALLRTELTHALCTGGQSGYDDLRVSAAILSIPRPLI